MNRSSLCASLAACAFGMLAIGCTEAQLDDGAPLDEQPVGEAQDGIINGSPDTTHQAVVMVVGSGSGCSGTIVHKAGGVGYVLTAAHCGNPQQVWQGNNSANPDYVYVVDNYQRHPGYNNSVYDFMMVRFIGAGSNTPVIPAMSPQEESINNGTPLLHVGYGKAGPPPGGNNDIRRRLNGQVSNLQPLTIEYNQQNDGGGPCSGDSGGPQLTRSGPERVMGVTSHGDPQCASYGTSGRVSAVYQSFIMAYINNTPIGPMNCEQCTQAATTGQGACMTAIDACMNHTDCNALLACFDGCSTQSCYNQCFNSHQAGAQVYNQIPSCICDTACMSECSSDPLCQGGGGTSTSAAVGSGASAQSSAQSSGSGGSTGVGGGGQGGAGGATSGSGANGNGNWMSGTDEQDYEGDVLMSACALDQAGSRRSAGAWALLGLALAALGIRRRSS
jgi:MYXO-CTERM domain-containing protein